MLLYELIFRVGELDFIFLVTEEISVGCSCECVSILNLEAARVTEQERCARNIGVS